MKCFLLIAFIFHTAFSFSQRLPSVSIIQDSIRSSFRGLSVPSDNVVWVSGSNGTVGRSTDGGTTWKWMIVPGFEKRDFRDIEAFDSLTAIIMAVDNPGNILKTTDGGMNWKIVFHKDQEGMFLDAMSFDGIIGKCIGDPIGNTDSTRQFFMLHTLDKGNTWILGKSMPSPGFSEAIFAASGSNIVSVHPRKWTRVGHTAFITGGIVSRFIKLSWTDSPQTNLIPIMQGKSSTGAFSLESDGKNKFYIAGGDYIEYWKDSCNVVYTVNAGKSWKRSSVHGYRSCIIQTGKKVFITCGTNGVDISFDGCKSWKLIHGDGAKGKDGFNVCAKSKTGKAVYFAGTGRIGKLIP